MKRTYLVTLGDPATGGRQRILVRAESPDGMSAFVCRKDLEPPLEFSDPKVISIIELKTKRPLPRTTLAQFVS